MTEKVHEVVNQESLVLALLSTCARAEAGRPIGSDFAIHVGDETFYAAKAVLAARSDYFRKLLTSNMQEAKKSEMTIKEVDPEIFWAALKFLCSGRLESSALSFNDLGAIHAYSSLLQLAELSNLVLSLMRARVDELSTSEEDGDRLLILVDLMVGFNISLSELGDAATSRIQDALLTRSDEKIQGLSEACMMALLEGDLLTINEVEALRLALRWCANKVELRNGKRQRQNNGSWVIFKKFHHIIRWEHIDANDFLLALQRYSALSADDELAVLRQICYLTRKRSDFTFFGTHHAKCRARRDKEVVLLKMSEEPGRFSVTYRVSKHLNNKPHNLGYLIPMNYANLRFHVELRDSVCGVGMACYLFFNQLEQKYKSVEVSCCMRVYGKKEAPEVTNYWKKAFTYGHGSKSLISYEELFGDAFYDHHFTLEVDARIVKVNDL